MDAVNAREIQQCFAAIAAAQAKYEENPNSSRDFFGVLHAVKGEIADWEAKGLYLGADVQRLRSECEAREAFITQSRQQRERGY